MSVCGDFGGVTAKGEPCQHRTEGLCWAHSEDGDPGGRPTKYTPDACRVVVEMGKVGCSRAEMAAELDIAMSTLAEWESAFPEFSTAATRARNLAQAWWEKQGRSGIWSRDFNAAAYKLQIMNRFPTDWRDRKSVEHSGPDGGPIETRELSDEELEARAAQLRRRLMDGDG